MGGKYGRFGYSQIINNKAETMKRRLNFLDLRRVNNELSGNKLNKIKN